MSHPEAEPRSSSRRPNIVSSILVIISFLAALGRTATAAQTGVITGTVFCDGQPLAGAELALRTGGGMAQFQKTATDAEGFYVFRKVGTNDDVEVEVYPPDVYDRRSVRCQGAKAEVCISGGWFEPHRMRVDFPLQRTGVTETRVFSGCGSAGGRAP